MSMGTGLTPRPNVASGAVMGYVVVVLGLFLTALQSNPSTLEQWLVALTPLAAAVAAFVGPKYEKAFRAAIGAGLVALALVVVSLVQGTAVLDVSLLLTLVIGVVQAVVTGLVENTTVD